MKRRTVFKHLAMASAAAWILPSCISDPRKVSIALNRLQVTAEDESLLEAIAGIIIPETDSPGAVATKAHLFALVMVDDCLPREEQERYLRGMRGFEDVLRRMSGKSFTTGSQAERTHMLSAFEDRLDAVDEDTSMFYRTTRNYIIQGYTSSQYFLTEVKPYELVPGPDYNGCAAVLSNEQKSLS